MAADATQESYLRSGFEVEMLRLLRELIDAVRNPAPLEAFSYRRMTVGTDPVVAEVNPGPPVAELLIVAEGQPIRWTDDGSEPTGTHGTPLAAGASLRYNARPALFGGLQFVRDSTASADAIVHVHAYTRDVRE
jgi:hypothetical protein